jgi:hypothetical protein
VREFAPIVNQADENQTQSHYSEFTFRICGDTFPFTFPMKMKATNWEFENRALMFVA